MKRKILSLLILVCAVTLSSAAPPQPSYHPWQGKKVAYLGDSITDPRNKAASKKYWGWLEEWLGITPYVYAVSGRQWDDIPRQTGKLHAEHGDDVDAVMILMGTNDYNNAVPLGRWYDETLETVDYAHGYSKRPETRMKRTPAMDPATFRGRINIALDSLKRTYPDKQIVLLTPLHRGGFYRSDSNWQIPESYMNRCGEYLDAYVRAVTEAGQVWAVPVIDLGALSGLYPVCDQQAIYFSDPDADRLHPNDAGHKRIAATLVHQLSTLPCTFSY